MQPAAKAVKAPVKEESSSEEESDEDSEMEDAVRLLRPSGAVMWVEIC